MSEPHERWPIETVLSRFGWQGTGRGSRWTEIKCPFHEDSHKSAGFNRIKNIFRCHACEAKGNSVTLVMQQLNCDQQRAVEWLQSEVPASHAASAPAQDRFSDSMGARIGSGGNTVSTRL